MRNAALALILLAAAAGTSEAQGRGRFGSQGIPPGQMPRAGECRVWYDNVPPGRQPSPMRCDQAERIASRSRNARVIYGDDRYSRNDDRYSRNNDERYRDRSYGYPGTYGNSYPNSSPYPNNNRGYGINSVAYDNGYRDGLEKGRDDANHNHSFDPVRQKWYRSADRGYNSRYGTKDAYKLTYRDGFEAGYEQSYRQLRGSRLIR